MEGYIFEKIPDQTGKVAIVTGANVGLGFETCSFLLEKNLTVIMACRDLDKATMARSELQNNHKSALIDIIHLDLSDLNSVKKFSSEFNSKYDRLDLLINNAGVMFPPYQTTKQGFELQFGVNYLAHFLLTGLLIDKILKTENSRIITLSSLAHRWGDVYFDDINFQRGYDKRKAYGQSKLACLMFAYELQRRLSELSNKNTISLAAHPGISTTNLGRYLPEFAQTIFKGIGPLIFNNPRQGAEPTVRAALDPHATGGEYYGPGGFREYSGKPVLVDSNSNSKDKYKANRLWKLSEKMTEFDFSL
ncbi:oxidoreductase [Marinigracilibium pacificum]|uniref:SDR family NAD(P)-dependent oxidoreductase n=1 Tax=Marinigracilibium pacificum TaxID=2729599 RepID=A0A848IV83_9BACT|nr:oxidoreductase [Marinigracilibium pacificum]NMM47596.1 SDR family NAD(P)-dependent oxidoreductase [Marinigracilibium pacificum]